MIKRLAIIIESSNVKGQQYLPGAKIDVANWVSFLKSDLGGKWADGEIIELPKPTSACIQLFLKAFKERYVFLAFSGHGYEEYDPYSRKYVSKICLNDNEQSVAIDTVCPKSFGTAIFDCCRGVEDVCAHISIANESIALNKTISLTQKTAMDSAGRGFASARGTMMNKDFRRCFMMELANKTTHEVVRMYSCSRNESAMEFKGDPKAGGYYTTFLMRGAEAWYKERLCCPYCDVYTTKQAHETACEIMRQINPQQHPEYTPLCQSYPFAVG